MLREFAPWSLERKRSHVDSDLAEGETSVAADLEVPWAVAFPVGAPPTDPGVRVHPTQIYEAIVLVMIRAALLQRPCA